MRLRLPRRFTPVSLIALIAGFLYFWFTPTRSPDVFGGFPVAQDRWLQWSSHVLQNPGFVIGYSEWYREPLWVGFRAHAVPPGRSTGRRDHFDVDGRTLARVSSSDYRDSGYDRGHLAPNYLISHLYGPLAQEATFRMSNIAPQSPRLNELLWQRLEEAEADIVAPRVHDLWVLTGPVLHGAVERLSSGVAVPPAFYRIWLDRDEAGNRHALAFLVPQDVRGDEPLSGYVLTVRQLEESTGLDFFAALSRDEQEKLENVAMPAYWQVPRYDRAPPRYAENFRERRRSVN